MLVEQHDGGAQLSSMKAQLRRHDEQLLADFELVQSEMKPQYIDKPNDQCAMCALNRIARRLLAALPSLPAQPSEQGEGE